MALNHIEDLRKSFPGHFQDREPRIAKDDYLRIPTNEPGPSRRRIAEEGYEVQQVDPDLVVRDDEGEIYTVRYDAVNAMLLNEFLKEHLRVQDLEKQVTALTAGLDFRNSDGTLFPT
jgi:hypothetical protein